MKRLIYLVCPPGAAVERPSIGLGLIKSILVRAGHTVTIQYENLRYAESIGIDLYKLLLNLDSNLGVLDWIFAEAAFPEFVPDQQEYMARVFSSTPSIGDILTPQGLLSLRNKSRGFIEEAVDRALAEDSALIGCSSSFCQHVASLALLRRVRVVDPTVTTLLGGANCEEIMGYTTHRLFNWVDFIISGDAEEVIVPLVDNIVSTGRSYLGACGVQGVFSPADRLTYNAYEAFGPRRTRAVFRNMGLIPRPTYDDYFLQLARLDLCSRIEPGLLIEASRGCWWGERHHCSFCGLNGGSMKYGSKEPVDVLADMAALTSEYRIQRIAFVDNILDYKYLNSLVLTLADRSDHFKIFVEIKANLKRDQVEVLAKAGICWIQPGIESLDSRILGLMKKGSAAWQNILLLKWCGEFGIRLFWNLIFGTPGEEEIWYGEQAKFIPYLSHLQPALPVQLQFCRFSPYCENPAQYGLALTATSAYRSIYPVTGEELDNLVYFFDDVSAQISPSKLDDHEQIQRPSANLVAFWDAIACWRDAWRESDPPVCQRVVIGEVVRVIDTRPCAIEPFTVLNACALSLLDNCEAGLSRLQLCRKMAAEGGFGRANIEDSLRMLESKGFILDIDDRLISLVHPEGIPPLPDGNEFPGGFLKEQMCGVYGSA